MVKRVLFIAVLLLSIVSIQSQARGRITVGEHQKIEKVATLPDSIYYQSESGKHFDLGTMYTVYEVCGIPVYIKEDGVLVGFEGDTYYDLDDEYKEAIKQDIQVEDLESLNKIPFWDRWGGKLIFIGFLIIVAIIYAIKSRKDDDEEELQEEEITEEKKSEE